MSLKTKKDVGSPNSLAAVNLSQDFSGLKQNLASLQKPVKQAVPHTITLSNKIHCKNLMKAPVGDIEVINL